MSQSPPSATPPTLQRLGQRIGRRLLRPVIADQSEQPAPFDRGALKRQAPERLGKRGNRVTAAMDSMRKIMFVVSM